MTYLKTIYGITYIKSGIPTSRIVIRSHYLSEGFTSMMFADFYKQTTSISQIVNESNLPSGSRLLDDISVYQLVSGSATEYLYSVRVNNAEVIPLIIPDNVNELIIHQTERDYNEFNYDNYVASPGPLGDDYVINIEKDLGLPDPITASKLIIITISEQGFDNISPKLHNYLDQNPHAFLSDKILLTSDAYDLLNFIEVSKSESGRIVDNKNNTLLSDSLISTSDEYIGGDLSEDSNISVIYSGSEDLYNIECLVINNRIYSINPSEDVPKIVKPIFLKDLHIWNPNESYDVGDVVDYDDKLYISKKSGNKSTPGISGINNNSWITL